jgi:long-chain acyl-CoA synthetase
MGIATHIRRVTDAGGSRIAVDLCGSTLSWSALANSIESLDATLNKAALGTDSLVGVLGRNRLEQVGGFIAILGAGRAVALINAQRPVGLIVEEITELKLACLIGSSIDLSSEVLAGAARVGTMVVAAEAQAGVLRFETISPLGSGPFRARSIGVLIEIQTSGTTGKPKRIPIAETTVEASLKDGVRTAIGAIEQKVVVPKSSPTLMFGPLVHTSGTFNTLMSVFEARPIVLFEKFDVEQFLSALRRYRPKFAPLPPTALQMILDSNATREDFTGMLAVRAGTAALPVDRQIAFEDRFGVPVLTTYGATEFMGVVTSWTLQDHRKYSRTKRGSVGRTGSGVQIRIVDQSSGEPLEVGQSGILEAKLERIDGGLTWIRTTDLGTIDSDGFLYISGRADDAIIRGGFKMMAGKISDVLRTFPGVNDVVVVGRPDARLGEVPIAVVEATEANTVVDSNALKLFAKQHLNPYEVPLRFYFVERLPRTVSDKVSKPEVQRMLDSLERSSARQ